MNGPRAVLHSHTGVYRVIRRKWRDPLDASFSQRKTDNRWNTPEFPALYCCCSLGVARSVALDLLRRAGVVLEDLRPEAQPALAEIRWSGRVVDVTSAKGIAAAGFDSRYPEGATIAGTQAKAANWHAAGFQGVVCRSTSMARQGFDRWVGDHRRWGELAIFIRDERRKPVLIRRVEGLSWLRVLSRSRRGNAEEHP